MRAEDNGRPRKYSIGKVLLTILARPTSSASPPLIQNLSAEVKIVENELVGHFVAQIQAKDLDDDVLFFDIIGKLLNF